MTNNTDWQAFDESTGASWFWALLFGPLYFAYHGFWGKAFVLFILNLFLIGFIVAPFMARPAWRERAKERAQQERMIQAMERRNV